MSTLAMPRFPEVLDSSMLAAFKSCPQLFRKVYIENWKSKEGANVHLTAGGAFAKGLEVTRKAFYTGEYEILARVPVLNPTGQKIGTKLQSEHMQSGEGDVERSIAAGLQALTAFYGDFECPADSAKSLERMMGAFVFYFDNYPLNMNAGFPIILPGGKRAIEVSFAHPLPINHPETGLPLMYCGRGDMICSYAGGVYGEDDKTTSRLGPTWSQQWDLRSQFIGYTWGFRQSGISLNGFLVRGVSILKTKFETQEAICNFSEFEVDRWYRELIEWLTDMVLCFKTNRWRYNLDHACTEFGGCGFKTVCKAQDESPWLEQYFERRHWDPVTREETKL